MYFSGLENLENLRELYLEINQISKKKKDIDVIIGGSPCQGFSMRGKKHIKDPRNNLIFEFFRIVDEIKPRIFRGIHRL